MCQRWPISTISTTIFLLAPSRRGIHSINCIKKFSTMSGHHSKNRRPTHFLCFPLTTDASVRQLGDSLAYFRSITLPASSGHGNACSPSEAVEHQNLRLLPEAAHRAPGTFHFTLGIMELSRQEDMDKATALLDEIDFLAFLREVDESFAAGKTSVRDAGRGRRRHGVDIDANENSRDKADSDILEQNREQDEDMSADDGGSLQPPRKQDGDGAMTKISKDSNRSTSESTTIQEPTSSSEHADLNDYKHPEDIASTPNPSNTATPAPTHSGPDTHSSSNLTSLTRPISPPSAPIPPLTTSLVSLSVFPTPSSARVFYARPSPASVSHRLLAFGNLIRQRFRAAGLITETRPLTLHATVANLIYVKSSQQGGRGGGNRGRGRGRGKDAGTVDAREILDFFASKACMARRKLDAEEGRKDGGGKGDGSGQEEGGAGAGTTTEPEPKPAATSDSSATTENEGEFIWATDIPITSVRLCKMGAEVSDKPGWGMEYPPVVERVFMPQPKRA